VNQCWPRLQKWGAGGEGARGAGEWHRGDKGATIDINAQVNVMDGSGWQKNKKEKGSCGVWGVLQSVGTCRQGRNYCCRSLHDGGMDRGGSM